MLQARNTPGKAALLLQVVIYRYWAIAGLLHIIGFLTRQNISKPHTPRGQI